MILNVSNRIFFVFCIDGNGGKIMFGLQETGSRKGG